MEGQRYEISLLVLYISVRVIRHSDFLSLLLEELKLYIRIVSNELELCTMHITYFIPTYSLIQDVSVIN
jgi:hypothetical protein